MHQPIIRQFLNKWQVGRRPLLITGHGRSGTTWVGNVFAKSRRALYCFEPGNPAVSGAGADKPEVWFRYLQPGQADPNFEERFDTAFRGLPYKRRWRRAAWHRLVPGYRMVIKEVAAFLSLEWLAARYDPAVLVVIRHPCPTILSELKQGTDPDLSRQAILAEAGLWTGGLLPYRAILEEAQTAVEILAAIWAVRLHVLARSLSRHPEWQVVHYEALCADPAAQFRQLFEALGLSWTTAVEQIIRLSSTSHKPGRYSGVRLSAEQADRWRREMDIETITAVRVLVEQFDLPFYRSPSDWPESMTSRSKADAPGL